MTYLSNLRSLKGKERLGKADPTEEEIVRFYLNFQIIKVDLVCKKTWVTV